MELTNDIEYLVDNIWEETLRFYVVFPFILSIRMEIFKNFLSGFVHIILNISMTAWRFPEILSLGNQFVTLLMNFGELFRTEWI